MGTRPLGLFLMTLPNSTCLHQLENQRCLVILWNNIPFGCSGILLVSGWECELHRLLGEIPKVSQTHPLLLLDTVLGIVALHTEVKGSELYILYTTSQMVGTPPNNAAIV